MISVTAISGLPSLLKSPTATAQGLAPTAKVVWGAKLGTVAPGVVVFSNTDTVPGVKFAITRSGLPSLLKSATATEVGSVPVAKLTCGANVGFTAPGAV